MNQALRYALIVGGGIVFTLLFLLATASSNSGFFDEYYSWLLGLNASIAAILLVFVVVALTRLYARYKRGEFGSRLMARLVLLFAGIGILPGLVIFLVSPAWRAWEWCVAEFLLAKNMNKRIHSPVISIGRFCNGNGSGKYGTQASTKGQFSRDPNQKLCSCHKGRRPFHLAVLTSANGMDRPCS